MEKKTLQPGDTIGVTKIPPKVFVEIGLPQQFEKEMKIVTFLQLFMSETHKPKIMCSCENQDFLWILEQHRRGEKRNEHQAFVFKVQITCTRCHRPKSFDIGPSNECYDVLRKNRTQGQEKWSKEITKICNDHFHKKH